jgi:GNAT superfamily N-acetyltransferase
MPPGGEPAGAKVSLVLRGAPDPRARALVGERLDQFNAERTGIADSRALDVILVDDGAGEPLGGLIGRTSLGVLFVDYVYLPAALRGIGYGSRMLAMAEAEAVRRGCRSAVLFTMEVQAPRFYQDRGYREFGRVECDPPGNARVFMSKRLG